MFESDIIVYDTDDDDEDSLSEAVSSPIRLWEKNGTVVNIPFTTPAELTDHQKTQIDKAIDEYASKSCIR